MYRIVRSGLKWYAVKFTDLEDEVENYQDFIDEGGLVILVDDIETFREEFHIKDIEIVK